MMVDQAGRYRHQLMATRIFLASIGNYASCYALVWLITPRLPMSDADAVLTSSSLSFALMVGLLLWCFATARLKVIILFMAAINAIALMSLILGRLI